MSADRNIAAESIAVEDLASKFETSGRLIRERRAALTAAECDQLIQTYIVQGKTIEQRFRATASLIRFALLCSRSGGAGDER